MIPKKISFYHKLKSKLFILRQNKKQAQEENIVSKRQSKAREIRRLRKNDSKKRWHVSFHSNLKTTSHNLGVDLVNELSKLNNGSNVLEIGCGSGKTVSELKERFPNLNISATGITISKDWTRHKNYKKIDWHVAHAENLARVMKGRQFDFIYSSMGLYHNTDLKKSLSELRAITKKGGTIIFDIFNGDYLLPVELIRKQIVNSGFVIENEEVVNLIIDKKLRRRAFESESLVFKLKAN